MFVTESGIVTLERNVHPSKAESPIPVTGNPFNMDGTVTDDEEPL